MVLRFMVISFVLERFAPDELRGRLSRSHKWAQSAGQNYHGGISFLEGALTQGYDSLSVGRWAS
jgi:hypothetical protein